MRDVHSVHPVCKRKMNAVAKFGLICCNNVLYMTSSHLKLETKNGIITLITLYMVKYTKTFESRKQTGTPNIH